MNRHVQLPGMPLAASDVHVCTNIGENHPPERLHVLPAPRPAATSGVWLVLALCPVCHAPTLRYCHDHNRNNWWLTVFGPKWRR